MKEHTGLINTESKCSVMKIFIAVEDSVLDFNQKSEHEQSLNKRAVCAP